MNVQPVDKISNKEKIRKTKKEYTKTKSSNSSKSLVDATFTNTMVEDIQPLTYITRVVGIAKL
jgi:hypothetical protein